MERPYILHMFTPGKQMSPFDVNMAADAGYQVIVPYTDVGVEQVTALTQDAIFSRGPKGVARTGIFIGGRDVALALEMLDAAKRAMVPPFEVSVFVDPSGAFTTAAAAVAVVERSLKSADGASLAGKGFAQAIKDDSGLREGVNTYAGKLTYEAVATSQGLEYTPLADVLPLSRV